MAAITPSSKQVPEEKCSDAPFLPAVGSDSSSSRATTKLHFLVSTGLTKPSPQLRKFIRSHVMTGRNQGRKLPKRKRKIKDIPELLSLPTNQTHFSNPSQSSATYTRTVICKSAVLLPTNVPRNFRSGFSTITLADSLEPGTIDAVLWLSSIAKQILFPLEKCMFFDRRAENWIAPLALDAAYLHAMIFCAQFYSDMLQSGQPASITRRSTTHLIKTLHLLRERVADEDDQEKLSDSTVAAIMSLASYACITGDFIFARYHIEGLYKIVNLRGGVSTFENNAKLLLEVLRCDLGIALHSSSQPIFFNMRPREPFMPYPCLEALLQSTGSISKLTCHDSDAFLEDIEHDIAEAWRLIAKFCYLVNFAVDSELRISTETFLNTMASVMYRLLNMHFEADSKDEVVRLGLIAFSVNAFLPWKQFGMSYSHFASKFRSCLENVASGCVSHDVMVWLLIVGSISVFEESDNKWLRPLLRFHIRLCNLSQWVEMQQLLARFLWIDLIHNKRGEDIFKSVNLV